MVEIIGLVEGPRIWGWACESTLCGMKKWGHPPPSSVLQTYAGSCCTSLALNPCLVSTWKIRTRAENHLGWWLLVMSIIIRGVQSGGQVTSYHLSPLDLPQFCLKQNFYLLVCGAWRLFWGGGSVIYYYLRGLLFLILIRVWLCCPGMLYIDQVCLELWDLDALSVLRVRHRRALQGDHIRTAHHLPFSRVKVFIG